MSVTLPKLIHPEAKVGKAYFEEELGAYYKTQGIIPAFARNEVSVIGIYEGELLIEGPGPGHPMKLFIGQWNRHPDSGLYVRFGKNDFGNHLALQQE